MGWRRERRVRTFVVYSELGPCDYFKNLLFSGSGIRQTPKLWRMVNFDYLFECAEPTGQTNECIDAGCHLDFAFMHRIYKNLEGATYSKPLVSIIESFSST